jgi:two-component system, LytTR family, sensor kinase
MKKKHIITLHIAFWVILLGMPILSIYLHGTQVPYVYYVRMYTSAVFDILIFYTCYLLIHPDYVFKGSNINKIMIGVFIVLFSFIRISTNLTVYYFAGVQMQRILLSAGIFIEETLDTFIFVVFAIFIRLIIEWVWSQRQRVELEAQTRSSEIALLRSQINPHFLFNTLNNIYSLVCKKSDDAPPAVMKLSEIMRYMLYDTNTDKVPLNKEINYLKSFIELQQLRLNSKDFIQFEISGQTHDKSISPMLLIPFVENAFKHGNKNITSPGIIIKLMVKDNQVTFEVINYIKKQTDTLDKEGGIGLSNIKRRLELLYPGKYSLNISNTNEIHSIRLIIEE